MAKKEENLLTLKEAAEKLAVKPVTLRKWDKEGKLRAVRIGSRSDRRYRERDILDFLARSQSEKIEWQEYVRNGVTFRVVSPIIESITSEAMERYHGVSNRNFMGFIKDRSILWSYDTQDIRRIGERILETHSRSDKDKEINRQTWERFHTLICQKSQDIYDSHPESWDKGKLADIFQEMVELNKDFYAFAISIDALDEIGMVKMEAILKKVAKDNKEYNDLFNTLTMPVELSINAEKEIDLLKLAGIVKKDKLSLDDDFIKNRIQEISGKYWWLDMIWGKTERNTDEIIWKSLVEMLESPADIGKKLEKLKNHKTELSARKEKLIRKHALDRNRDFRRVLAMIEEFAVYHDWRKEMQMKQSLAELILLKEISRRLKIGVNILECAGPEEILALLFGDKLDLQRIYQRDSGCLILVKDGKRTDYVGLEAEKKWIEEKGAGESHVNDIQGTGASLGKAVGEVLIAFTAQEANKIKEGQILVTPMTSPDFVPAMKKAGAIVTDEGGITCHAAILSRELGIPCIIGTRNATRVLRSGQKVEVKANHGVVVVLE